MTLDMDACTLSFAVNGEDQGIAYDASSGMGRCTLVPAAELTQRDAATAAVAAQLRIINPDAK